MNKEQINSTNQEAETKVETSAESAEIESKVEVENNVESEATAEDALTKEIETLRAQLEAEKDQMLRIAAEAQNARKRAEKEVIDAKNYALSSFAKDILAVCDNLERSLSAAKQQIETVSEEQKAIFDTLTTGVEMTYNMLIKALEARDICKLNTEIGAKFDPHLHQAMFEQPAEEGQEAGLIANIIQDGYMIKDRVLRAAMVGITKKA